MLKSYLKPVIIILLINLFLTTIISLVGQWELDIISVEIARFSILIALLFIPYFFLSKKTPKNGQPLLCYLPSLILIVLFIQYKARMNTGSFYAPYDHFIGRSITILKLFQIGLVVIVNYLRSSTTYDK